ncbi:MAG TPA: hypothetical protein VIS99_15685 [Terrimicrobiaceae bacterium]
MTLDSTQRVDANLLELLCCPITHQCLRIADEKALRAARLKSSKLIAEGLIRADGKMLYPILHGIPLLVPEEGIPL